MRITECYIQGFGKLKSKKYVFNKGINSFTAQNGYGKSTAAAFIAAMFYGLPDTKKASLDENERRKYLPWDGTAFGGSLSFEKDGKLYRIERTFSSRSSEDTFLLYDAGSGRLSSDFSERLGEELFGIDADGFLRTVFLSEKSLSEKNENKSISAKLSGTSGISADTGELDSALKILDEERKLYLKRGGAGIIFDTRSRSRELYEEIARLKEKEAQIAIGEEAISKKNREIAEAKAKKEDFERARGELELGRRVKSYREQYENMKRGVAAEEERYKRLSEFFKNGRPTLEEIDEARLAELEFERLASEGEISRDDAELTELRAIYGNISPEEVERIYAMTLRAEGGPSTASPSLPRELSRRVPTEAEIEFEIRSLKRSMHSKGRFAAAVLSLLSGIGLGVAAFFGELMSLPFIALLSSGAVLSLVGLILLFTKKSSRAREAALCRAEAFIVSVSGEVPKEEPLQALETIKTRIEEYKSGLAGEKDRLKKERESEAELREIYDFLAKFPAPKTKTLSGAVLEIREGLRRMEALSLMSEKLSASAREKQRAAAAKMEAVRHFLSRFNTVTDRPFDEIREHLSEFLAVGAALDAKRRGLDDFVRMNGLSDMSYSESLLTEAEIDGGRKSAEERVFALTREKALLERQLEADRLDVERIGALIAEKAVVDAEEKKYQKNLDIIVKTKKYLTEAHEKMAARYLEKTASGFKRYARAIGGEEGEFVIDTDLTLTKYEGASARRRESYSRGTRELYALSLRLALTDALFDGELPFIILDDPFMALDDKTAAAALSLLREISKTKQVIYFTCSKSRAL